MFENIPNAKTVTLKLSRYEVCKLLIGLNVLLEITVELILMLWAKTERHYTDDKIKEMMRRTTE